MQMLATIQPRFRGILNPSCSWFKILSVRAFSSSLDYGNQSRGGLPRFFSEVLPPSKGGVVRVQGDEFWHMTKVLRLSINDRVELFNGKGGLIEGCIERIDRAGADFVALEDPKFLFPQSTQWHVFAAFGTLKGGRSDWLIEKCTELGASSVTPLLTERSPSISDNRVDRLQRVILAATKQCQRLHEMILNPPMKIDDILPLMLATIQPRFGGILNPSCSWFKILSVRAFSSSLDYGNQSRGGLPRFFSEVLPPSKGGVVRVQGDEFWHMTKVLRLSINDRVELFNGKGGLIEGCIERIDRAGADFVALEDPKFLFPQSTQWHVFAAFGTLKGGRSDWLIEKCTELGASSVTPLLTERSPSISDNRVDRLQRVILAATKQCQRLHEMILNPPMKIDDILPLVSQSKLSFVAVAEATPLVSALTSSRLQRRGLIIVGPEGDFTEKELNMITEAGATTVGLGQHRLRVETATTALLATLMLWSDSQQPVDC